MKYMILIYKNPAMDRIWDELSEDQRTDFTRGHLALAEQLAGTGELVATEGLDGPDLAKCVTLRDGKTVTTDGPYAEAKEHLAGFYLVECDTVDRAIELAGQVPDARYGEVEVRPVLDFSELDL